MSQSESVLKAAVNYKNVAGTLSLNSSHHLSWDPSSSTTAASPLTLNALKELKGLSVSKATNPKCMLQLNLKEGHRASGIEAREVKILLTFTAPSADALTIREKFKDQLASAVRAGLAAEQNGAPDQAPQRSDGAAATASPSGGGKSGTPQPQTNAAIRTSGASSSSLPPVAVPREIDLRVRVLKANPELAALHREVVRSREVTDADFWAHPSRAALVRAERTLAMQKAGRNARLADPRPQANERGELALNITPEIIRDMFEQHPVVARAYNDNVPSQMDEVTFWTRYFKSRLYHRLRTSARSAASEHIQADDDVFDNYLEEEDDGIAPRKTYNAHDALLDLATTEEDHGETGNTKDYTMRAGHERRALPLLRRFNEHSQSLLDSALGSQDATAHGSAARSRRIVGGVGEEYDFGKEGEHGRYYDSIVIDDLEEQEKTRAVPLDVREQQSTFDGGATNNKKRGRADATDEELQSLLETMRQIVDETSAWQLDDLGSFDLATNSGGTMAMNRMLAQLRQKAESRARAKVIFTDGVQKQLAACQAATNEFLRQFWVAVAPQAESALRDVSASEGNEPTSAALKRRAKAQRMVEMLRKTDDRIESVARAAQEVEPDGRGGERVHDAFRHTRQAVTNALHLAARMTA